MLLEKIKELNIPVVEKIDSFSNVQSLVEHTRALKGVEGFILNFEDGHRCKIKADEYVRVHKCLDLVRYDRNIVDLIVNEELDDVVSLMPEREIKRIRDFEKQFWSRFKSMETHLLELYDVVARADTRYPTRKDVATRFVPTLRRKEEASFIFKMLDGKNVRDLMLEHVKKHSTSNTKWEACAEWLGLSVDTDVESV